MLGVVGPVEETCKFLAVRLRAYRSPYFEEPMDGLVHAAAASLGFASLENLFYILDYGPEVMIIRAPLSTLGHLIFGSLWGYALGLRHEGGDARLVWRGLGLAALLHGLFNVAVSLPLGLLWGAIIVLVGATRAYREFKRTQRASPFRYRRNVPLVVCPNCDAPTRVSNRYCNACGVGVEGNRALDIDLWELSPRGPAVYLLRRLRGSTAVLNGHMAREWFAQRRIIERTC